MKNDKDILKKRIADILGHHHWEVCDCDLETNPHHCPVEVFYPKLIKVIEDNEIAHTHELEELDREWREKVAGLLMGKKCDTCRWGGRYVYMKNCPFCPDGAEFNSKINQLLEEE